ncbi:GntR family transcriptional regulator [Neokomagataea tanensis]|uniref:GntR family transcriptional regulator n=1 Tax=Neokomagataea tanensis TaxID=661191 RepID=A0A4Y6V3P2_9PROT|nr:MULTISPECIES: GntR family transcriptional regulator [Neokomagataea]QDH24563.1 GntR family transcriptional regulator [Neokomagataea tanensis]
MSAPANRSLELNTQTISEKLYYILRENIISGDFKDGEPIRQDILASEFGTSKIPLREALARLEKDGLVVSQANRGFSVIAVSTRDADEIFRLRLQLEPEAVLDGSRQATKQDHALARAILTNLKREQRKGSVKTGTLNREFHMALIRPGVGDITYSIIEKISILTERYVRFHLLYQDRHERANLQHEQILESWIQKDYEPLKKLCIDHITQTVEELREDIGNKNAPSILK